MSRNITTVNLHLEPADNARLASLCGPFDDNIKQIERRMGVEISYRNNHIQILGNATQAEAVAFGAMANVEVHSVNLSDMSVDWSQLDGLGTEPTDG